MAKKEPLLAQSLVDLTLPAMKASTAAEFMRGIKSGFDGLYDALMGGRGKKKDMLLALDAAFAEHSPALRQRRVLELCAWPIFDKPALPQAPAELPEFLWLFVLPFTVKVSLNNLGQPRLLQGDVVDAKQMLSYVADSGWLNEKGALSAFPTLLTREDFHLYGPKSLAAAFVHAERGDDEEGLQPMPVAFDPDIESSRVVTLFMVCASRMPVGEHQLLYRQEAWDGSVLAREVAGGLVAQGWEVDAVTSMPPCSMAEALFRCAGAGVQELGTVLDLAVEHYGSREIVLRYPMEGMAELTAVCTEPVGDEELVLLPPFQFLEPKAELQACVQRLCKERGLEFKGAYSVAAMTSSMLH